MDGNRHLHAELKPLAATWQRLKQRPLHPTSCVDLFLFVEKSEILGLRLVGSPGVGRGKPNSLAAGGCCIMNENGNTAGA